MSLFRSKILLDAARHVPVCMRCGQYNAWSVVAAHGKASQLHVLFCMTILFSVT